MVRATKDRETGVRGVSDPREQSRKWPEFHKVRGKARIAVARAWQEGMDSRSGGRGAEAPVAGLVLAATILAMLMPARLRDFPQPWEFVYKGGHAAVWGASLIVLLDHARRTRRAVRRLSAAGAA